MNFQNKLGLINSLTKRIEQNGKMSLDVLNKINYKFRLDWNFYSNKMEGNTLTIEETKSVMVGNISVHNKPIKHVLEMQGHDNAIVNILKIGKGELNISEKRIIELHKAIMYEENIVDKEKIGKWKSQPNHVYNYRDEKFDFTMPELVAEEMHDLINWVNAEKDKIKAEHKDALHPVQLAFEFHLRYLTIHPFYDGNGRTGRILTNLILISYGYPPIYVKESDKEIYYRYLAEVQAYGAAKDLFFEIMADYLLRSLQIVQDAIDGKVIDEPEDLDKKLQLLEMELEVISDDEEVKMRFSKATFFYCYENWLKKLNAFAIPVVQKFNKLFTGTNHSISISQASVYANFINEPFSVINENLTESINKQIERVGITECDYRLQTFYGTLIKGGLKTFGCNYSILIKFTNIKYEVWVDEFDAQTGQRIETKLLERLLHQFLTDIEMKEIAQKLGNTIYNHIDYNTKRMVLDNTNYKQTPIGLIPSDWEVKKLGDIITLLNGRAYSQDELLAEGKYRVLRVGNLFSNNNWYYSDLELEADKYVVKDDLMYSWSASFGPHFWHDEKVIYHYHIWKILVSDKTTKEFIYHLLNYDKELILSKTQGGTMVHITKGDMENRKLPIPPLPEQQKIATILSTWDKAIDNCKAIIEKLQQRNKGLAQQLLTGKMRVKGFEESKWKDYELRDVFNFEQPNKYLTNEFENDDSLAIPVLTANKSFILGYTADTQNSYKKFPVIIFDDFTTASKYVDFEFKIKSSAIKLLSIKEGFYLRFAYERLQIIETNIQDHKRRWISEFENKIIAFPYLEEQKAIANILDTATSELNQYQQQLQTLQQQKKGLMQQLLTGKTRVKI